MFDSITPRCREWVVFDGPQSIIDRREEDAIVLLLVRVRPVLGALSWDTTIGVS